MAKSIIELTRGIPTTAKGWLDIFGRLNRFLKVSGDELIIGGDIQLPAGSVGTDELEDLAVTDPKLRHSQACSVIGRSVNSAGAPTDIQASANGHFLRRSGDVLSFGEIVDTDIPSSIARDSDVATAIADHEAEADPHPGYTTAAELSSAIATHEAAADPHTEYVRESFPTFAAPAVMQVYTVATLPSAATWARGIIYVADESGGAVLAFSDGSNWRRVTDRAVVS